MNVVDSATVILCLICLTNERVTITSIEIKGGGGVGELFKMDTHIHIYIKLFIFA
jgi:hypothetical protein